MAPLWVIIQADVLNTTNKDGMLSLKKMPTFCGFLN